MILFYKKFRTETSRVNLEKYIPVMNVKFWWAVEISTSIYIYGIHEYIDICINVYLQLYIIRYYLTKVEINKISNIDSE